VRFVIFNSSPDANTGVPGSAEVILYASLLEKK
jgi:hypothetical protein